MKKKQLKISIKQGQWICKDATGLQGAGITPREAWVRYHLITIDKTLEKVYNNENVR